MNGESLAEAWARVDSRRARSRQKTIGASQVGGCRRQAGYIMAGVEETDETGPKMVAYLGTAIHKPALEVLAKECGYLPEVRLDFGTADAVHLDTSEVLDLKTVSRFVFDARQDSGPTREHLWQVHLYAWMLNEGPIPAASKARLDKAGWKGKRAEQVSILYLCRDTGRESRFDLPFDQAITDEAFGWLDEVRAGVKDGGPGTLPRDGDGPGLDWRCDSCPFRTACWGPQPEGEQEWQSNLVRDDADVETALGEYLAAQIAEKEARRIKDLARAKLSGSASGQYGAFKLGWRSQNGREIVDLDRMKDLYEAAGLEVPMRRGTPIKVISVRRAKGAE